MGILRPNPANGLPYALSNGHQHSSWSWGAILSEAETTTTPGLKHAEVRKLLHEVINESLRLGGRPDSAIAEETDGGEIIDVRTRGPNGDLYSLCLALGR